MQYFSDMKKLNLTPDPRTYQIVIATFIRNDKFEFVNKFVTTMIKDNLELNEGIFTTIINNF